MYTIPHQMSSSPANTAATATTAAILACCRQTGGHETPAILVRDADTGVEQAALDGEAKK